MAKVKCEFCGNFIDDTLSTCPSCGGVNENHQRVAKSTPKTIEELRSWYTARNLPPENVTRFFIGKDIREPKAFGIFEKNGEFTVYKNKADGTRAVRYKGTDEAYAVNELYLRLKEEILNQKRQNVEKRSRVFTGSTINNDAYSQAMKERRTRHLKKSLLKFAIMFVVAVFIVPVSFFCLSLTLQLFDIGGSLDEGYYVSDDNTIYYFSEENKDKQYEWWIYDVESSEWSLYAKYDKGKEMPEELDEESPVYDFYYDLAEKYGIDADKLCIENSKAYIDAGHHQNPSTAYYYYDDDLYYFIDDSHSSYGNSDNTGWYIYNTKSSDWEKYCDADDKQALGEDLWYSDSEYRVGSTYDNIYNADEYLTQWNPSGFETTSWYSSYESNESAYDRHLEEIEDDNDSWDNDDWDDDDDWDWDSNDSWDSGDTDWDSDW